MKREIHPRDLKPGDPIYYGGIYLATVESVEPAPTKISETRVRVRKDRDGKIKTLDFRPGEKARVP